MAAFSAEPAGCGCAGPCSRASVLWARIAENASAGVSVPRGAGPAFTCAANSQIATATNAQNQLRIGFPWDAKLTRMRHGRNRNASTGHGVIFAAVEKARPSRSDHIPPSATPGAPLHRAFAIGLIRPPIGQMTPQGLLTFPSFFLFCSASRQAANPGRLCLGVTHTPFLGACYDPSNDLRRGSRKRRNCSQQFRPCPERL